MKLELHPSQQSLFTNLLFHKKQEVISGNFPDFLIVGPQRTGTTWLTENLRLHPEIFLSFPKELYFFNRLPQPNSQHSLHYERFEWNLLSKSPKAFAKEVAKVAYFDVIKTGKYKANELEWYLKFFELNNKELQKRSKNMQLRYQEVYRPKVIGEATASYATLSPNIIHEITLLNPDIKVILMIRNPAERAWSHAKKDLVRNAYQNFEAVSEKAFYEFFNNPYQVKCGQYSQQIHNWKNALKPGHLYIGLYQNIKTEPRNLLRELYTFLNITNADKYISDKVDQVINKTGDNEIPDQYKSYLDDLFSEEKKSLYQKYQISLS